VIQGFEEGSLVFNIGTRQIFEVSNGKPFYLIWGDIFFDKGIVALSAEEIWELLKKKYGEEQEEKQKQEEEKEQIIKEDLPEDGDNKEIEESMSEKIIDVDAFGKVMGSIIELVKVAKSKDI